MLCVCEWTFELGPVFFFVPDRFDFVDSLFFETISSVPGTGKYAPEAKYILFGFQACFPLDQAFIQSESGSWKIILKTNLCFWFKSFTIFGSMLKNRTYFAPPIEVLSQPVFQVNICRFIHFVLVSSIFPISFHFYFRILENISNKSRKSDQKNWNSDIRSSLSVRTCTYPSVRTWTCGHFLKRGLC